MELREDELTADTVLDRALPTRICKPRLNVDHPTESTAQSGLLAPLALRLVRHRQPAESSTPPMLIAFDVLYLKGRDLSGRSLRSLDEGAYRPRAPPPPRQR